MLTSHIEKKDISGSCIQKAQGAHKAPYGHTQTNRTCTGLSPVCFSVLRSPLFFSLTCNSFFKRSDFFVVVCVVYLHTLCIQCIHYFAKAFVLNSMPFCTYLHVCIHLNVWMSCNAFILQNTGNSLCYVKENPWVKSNQHCDSLLFVLFKYSFFSKKKNAVCQILVLVFFSLCPKTD